MRLIAVVKKTFCISGEEDPNVGKLKCKGRSGSESGRKKPVKSSALAGRREEWGGQGTAPCITLLSLSPLAAGSGLRDRLLNPEGNGTMRTAGCQALGKAPASVRSSSQLHLTPFLVGFQGHSHQHTAGEADSVRAQIPLPQTSVQTSL